MRFSLELKLLIEGNGGFVVTKRGEMATYSRYGTSIDVAEPNQPAATSPVQARFTIFTPAPCRSASPPRFDAGWSASGWRALASCTVYSRYCTSMCWRIASLAPRHTRFVSDATEAKRTSERERERERERDSAACHPTLCSLCRVHSTT